MKVAVIARNMHPLPTSESHSWAPGIAIAAQVDALAAAGAKVRVYAAKGSKVEGELIDFDMAPGLDLFPELEKAQKDIRLNFYRQLFLGKVVEHLRSNPVDVVHLHDYRDFPILNSAGLNAPVVVTLHGNYAYNLSSWPEDLKTDLSKMPLITLTPAAAVEGIKPPIGTIGNIVDTNFFSFISKPKKRLVFVGRCTGEKGLDIAIDAAIKANLPLDIYGTFAGAEEEKSFKEKIDSSELISYRGRLGRKDIAMAYDALAVLMPVREPEGFPLVALEALSSGTPIISTNTDPMPQIIQNGKTGFIVPLNNSTSSLMAESILQSEGLERTDCRRYVEANYSSEVLADKYLELFSRLIPKS